MRKPPNDQPIAAQSGKFSSLWQSFFTELFTDFGQATNAPIYTVATVPAAAKYTGSMIYVSNESGGAVIAFSDGVNWRRVTDRAIIS